MWYVLLDLWDMLLHFPFCRKINKIKQTTEASEATAAVNSSTGISSHSINSFSFNGIAAWFFLSIARRLRVKWHHPHTPSQASSPQTDPFNNINGRVCVCLCVPKLCHIAFHSRSRHAIPSHAIQCNVIYFWFHHFHSTKTIYQMDFTVIWHCSAVLPFCQAAKLPCCRSGINVTPPKRIQVDCLTIYMILGTAYNTRIRGKTFSRKHFIDCYEGNNEIILRILCVIPRPQRCHSKTACHYNFDLNFLFIK